MAMKLDEIFRGSKGIEYFFDQLEEISENSDCYLLDILPMTVQDPEKYAQFELVWEHIVDDKDFLKQKAFFVEEERFISFFKKLWLYNKTKVYVHEFSRPNERFLKLIDVEEEIFLWIKKNAGKTISVTSIDKLELLIRLGTRDIISNIFVYEDMEIICWSTGGLAWRIYFNKPDVIELVKDMANVEGLYLYYRQQNT
ncbi:MAG: hypothetical protein RBR24_07510 [Candidatus Carbobacillus sp.]|nr:hypothetical protein [Candidatus Carbobacillus sp.]